MSGKRAGTREGRVADTASELTNSEEVAVKNARSAVTSDTPRRPGKLARLRDRMRDPEWRRYGYLLLGGKALGIAMLLGVVALLMNVFGSPAQADDVVLKGNDIVNPINTVWTLIAAFLVFGMQAGFTMLEAGFSRSRETVNVLMECVVDTCLCGLLFYAWGFAFMFGSGTPFFGTEFFFLQGVPTTYGSSGVAFLAFWIFQYAFADTCSTITSGAMIGRTGFVGDIVYSIGVSGFIYPIFGHWAWGPDGWLATMGSDGNFFPALGTRLPRLRGLHGGAQHRRLRGARWRDRAGPPARPALQARRRRAHAAA
jgi:Amt family ammonium transporter